MLPHRWRWLLILAASYFFYGYWKIEYLSLIIISTLVDYSMARIIGSSTQETTRRIALAGSIFTNLGLLAFFKYAGWFMNDVLHPAGILGQPALESFQGFWDFALPVGISFYTFQTLGYTIDVYYGKAEAERNPLKFALFVSYFPQLVAGPIERFSHLHKQLFHSEKFNYSNLQQGGRQILYGLFIKMCVADNLSPMVDQVFGQSEHATSAQLILGAIMFGFQIYSDFHGYSLIAIGTARLFGVELMDNFKTPYLATSIRSFWSKWHISLSTWFRDYLYIPLGGNRGNQLRLGVNIMIVFLVSGLWHGANWTFVAWGGLHGLGYLMERWFVSSETSSWLKIPRWFVTMVIVFTAWIFFRASSLDDAASYIDNIISGGGKGIDIAFDSVLISIFGLFVLSDIAFRNGSFNEWISKQVVATRWAVYAMLIFFITAFAGVTNHPFIYFQF